ncbi:hypothetical protein R1sor_003069 [Riccia sorocarpa]|uniref:Uncharacterized protein n=1 Tax=Riccia sorocarpa TaxID=122646 RepID=A0ABD3H388_9MARC
MAEDVGNAGNERTFAMHLIHLIQKVIDMLEVDSLTKGKKSEMKASLSQAIQLISSENSIIGVLQSHLKATSELNEAIKKSSGPSPLEKLHIFFSERSYPHDLSHAELMEKINTAIHESGNSHLKIQAVQKYKHFVGIIVESNSARNDLLQSGNSWGPKAFASLPKEKHQVLIHDVLTELYREEIESGLNEDNITLTMMETPRWLLKDRSTKRRSSLLVTVKDAEMADGIAARGLALNGLFLRTSIFIPNFRPTQCYRC